MLAKVKEASAKRDFAGRHLGPHVSAGVPRAADDLFAELDRMAEKIGDEDARAHAAEEFGDLDLDSADAFDPPPRAPEWTWISDWRNSSGGWDRTRRPAQA